MRELKVVGLDVDGKRIICETADSGDRFVLHPDDRLHAALRGDRTSINPPQIEVEVPTVLRPKDIQARIRAGASVEQVASAAGESVSRVERFAHPVLLERSRAAELATAAHPVLADGPSVLTLLETVTTALVARGLDPESPMWDAWRNEDGRWTVQMAWKAGRSDNVAHFRYTPGAHGGTATAFDDAAAELDRPQLRSAPAAVGRSGPRVRRRTPVAAHSPGTRGPVRTAAGTTQAARPQAQARGTRLGGRPARRSLRQPTLSARAQGPSDSLSPLAADRHREQRQPTPGHTDSAAEHEPPPHRKPAPTPHRRGQSTHRDDVEADGKQRVHPGQAEAEHDDRRGGDGGDEPRHRQPGPPRGGVLGHSINLSGSLRSSPPEPP